VHVTHDLFLVAARRILKTASVFSNYRPPYLGGFGVVLRPDRTIVFEAGRNEEA